MMGCYSASTASGLNMCCDICADVMPRRHQTDTEDRPPIDVRCLEYSISLRQKEKWQMPGVGGREERGVTVWIGRGDGHLVQVGAYWCFWDGLIPLNRMPSGFISVIT